MQLCHLFSFNDLVSYSLYSQLDVQTKNALSCTSKEIRKHLYALNDKEKVANEFARQVLKHFKITHSSLPLNQLHRLLFYPKHVIGLGECHIEDTHRKQNGRLINCIYTPAYNVRVECARQERSLIRSISHGQLKYVHAPIRSRAKSWDLATISSYELLYQTMSYIHFSQGVIEIFDPFQDNGLENCIQLIKSNFPKEDSRSIFKKLQKYNKLTNPSLQDKKVYAIEIAEKALFILDQRMKALDIKFGHECNDRDRHLEKMLLRDLTKHNKSSIFISGSDHHKSLLKSKQTQALFEKTGIPLLFITPKSNVKRESHSFLHLIEKQVKSIDAVTPKMLQPLKKLIYEIDPVTIDCDTNHFGAWQYICERVIKLFLYYKKTGEM